MALSSSWNIFYRLDSALLDEQTMWDSNGGSNIFVIDFEKKFTDWRYPTGKRLCQSQQFTSTGTMEVV